MSYLSEKQKKNKFYKKILIIFIFLVIVFIFRKPVFFVLSRVINTISYPFVKLGSGVNKKVENMNYVFYSKKDVFLENEKLKNSAQELNIKLLNLHSLEKENLELKEILNRKKTNEEFVLGVVLSKPNKSIYDSLVLDIGSKDGIKEGALVFANGDVPIGRIDQIFESSSRVILFSTSGQINNVLLSPNNINVDMVGRGGGNFSVSLPRDLIIDSQAILKLPSVHSYFIGIFEKVISSDRDAFQDVLFTSPVNMQELKFVQVEK
jgi:cell shape-determining protein MreC